MRTAVTILTAAILPAVMAAVMVGVLAGVLAWSATAKASEIDLSIKQFQSAGKNEVTLILAWLDGYYRAEDDPPVIDADQLGANAKKLGDYCAAHPDTKLITAADTLFERE